VTPEAAREELPEHAVLAQAKAAVVAGDRAAALTLLRQLQIGPPIAAQVTPTLAETLVATAREVPDVDDSWLARPTPGSRQHAARSSGCCGRPHSIRKISPRSGRSWIRQRPHSGCERAAAGSLARAGARSPAAPGGSALRSTTAGRPGGPGRRSPASNLVRRITRERRVQCRVSATGLHSGARVRRRRRRKVALPKVGRAAPSDRRRVPSRPG
jgi:hypothetical protein